MGPLPVSSRVQVANSDGLVCSERPRSRYLLTDSGGLRRSCSAHGERVPLIVQTNRFDGFGFSFIQIARLLKKIFPPRRRLVLGEMIPLFKEEVCASSRTDCLRPFSCFTNDYRRSWNRAPVVMPAFFQTVQLPRGFSLRFL
jgi:hypothetical protein